MGVFGVYILGWLRHGHGPIELTHGLLTRLLLALIMHCTCRRVVCVFVPIMPSYCVCVCVCVMYVFTGVSVCFVFGCACMSACLCVFVFECSFLSVCVCPLCECVYLCLNMYCHKTGLA